MCELSCLAAEHVCKIVTPQELMASFHIDVYYFTAQVSWIVLCSADDIYVSQELRRMCGLSCHKAEHVCKMLTP